MIQDDQDNSKASHHVITTGVSPYVQAKTPSNASTDVLSHDKPSNASTNGVPYISKHASPLVSKDPSSHTSTDQPLPICRSSSYEAAIIDTVE